MSLPYSIHLHAKSPALVQRALECVQKAPLSSDYKLAEGHADNSQAASVDSAGNFDVDAYMEALNTSTTGCVLYTAPFMPSSQTFLCDHFGSVPPGSVVTVQQQGAGKGRGGNTWTSPPGCLMFSMTLTHLEGRTLPFMQYVVSLAVVEAVQEEARRCLQVPAGQGGSIVDVRLKWPNDIYGPGGLKIGGVLCHSTYDMALKHYNVTVGVGLNMFNSEPTTCVADIVEGVRRSHFAEQGPCPPQAPRLLAGMMNRLEALLAEFEGGFAPLEALYLRHWLHSNQRVTLLEQVGTRENKVELIIKGLTPSGYLLAYDDHGSKFELHPDGNSMDFFQGLVRKKMY